jgi:hypothetical protein
MQPEEHEKQVVPSGHGSWFRSPYTLIAWLAPILTPIAFALLVWSGLIDYAMKLATGFLGASVSPGDPMLMFMWAGSA